MQKNIYQRVAIFPLILALLSITMPPQPVLAARMESDHNPAALQSGTPPLLSDCPVTTVTTFTNSTPITIPADPDTVTSTITVADVDPYLWDLNLQTFIQHTFAADLDITIQSPAGTVVTLTTDNGNGNDNVFDGTRWDDSADDPATDHIYTNLVLASPLSPEEPLAAFIGEDPNGDWVLTIADDQPSDGGFLNSWTLSLSTAPALPIQSTATFTNSTPITIPTGPGTVTSTITVAGVDPYLWDLNLQTFIQHTFAADLDITIQSPAGTVVTLTTDNGAGNDNIFDGTRWDDSADDPATDHIYTNLVLASPLSPEEPLAAFIGEDPNGNWVLTIADDLAGDGGFLNSWTLSLSTSSGCPTPLNVNTTQPASKSRLTHLEKILVGFNQAVISDGTSKAANYSANYLLIERGKNKAFDTATCEDGLMGDDVEWAIASAIYDPTQFTTTLSFTNPLAKGSYRLFICGTTSIWSVDGRKLNDGDSDTVVDFTIKTSVSANSTATTTTLPSSGFAPGAVTVLPIQPAEKAYFKSELTLEIPKNSVKTEIIGVPQIDGTWDVSWLDSRAGWLEGSAFPTWAGNSVLTGHVTNANGGDGPFANLNSLSWGDQIVIHAFGQTYIYEVRTINRWTDPKDVGVLIKHEDLPWVTLITCNGYDEKTNTYRWRTVVRAVQIKVINED